MSKFWANVKFKKEKNAEYLIKAFFQNFNPASSIVVKGKEAKLEIVFREPPIEIIEAISHCEIIELNYGNNLKEYEEDENVQIETENNYEYGKVEDKSFYQTGEEKAETTPKTKTELITISELEEIAKKATSFEHFVKLVAEWMEMEKKQEFFINLVMVSTEIDNITWKDLEKALKEKNISYIIYDKVWTSNQVTKKFKEYSVTILPFLKIIRQYKDYSFKNAEKQQTVEENTTKQETEKKKLNIEEKVEEFDESPIPKNRVKMECMPEIKDFEEILANVDKTEPVEQRVRYVLEAMGLNKIPVKEQKQIVEIASTAVKKERITFDSIFTNIPIRQVMEVRLTFSQFINNFVQKYEGNKMIKILDFLEELQKTIMLDSEIERF